MKSKTFLSDDFLLRSSTARRIYHEYAAALPIIDYHCHIPVSVININNPLTDITDIWLSGDHYKWRLMRLCGHSEDLITGNADNEAKFAAWADTIERCPGNPLYHWTHMELMKYFDCDELLTSSNASKIYRHCNRILSSGNITPQKIIYDSNVRLLCTTDDPADDLKHHSALNVPGKMDTKVLPTFRPDKYLKINSEDFTDKIVSLCSVRNISSIDLNGVTDALSASLDHFSKAGCISADFGLDKIPFHKKRFQVSSVKAVFEKRIAGKKVSEDESDLYVSYIMTFLASEFSQRGWTMMLHVGASRNVNSRAFNKFGPDYGFDSILSDTGMKGLSLFLDDLEKRGILPKTILFSLSPNDDALIDTLCGCFYAQGVRGLVQHGVAWWFNDTLEGIRDHLINYASLGVLGNHLGMLTDSRSLLSYVRHDYFRRILCDLLGGWIDDGMMHYPDDKLAALITGICFGNIESYLNSGSLVSGPAG